MTCFFSSSHRLACALVALSLLGACKAKPEPPEPTEPWLKKPAERTPAAAEAATPRVFDVDHGGRLSLRLPAKEATPRGSVGGLGGAFTVPLGELALTRGTVLFDLSSLVLDADGPGADESRTAGALNWLGLGPAVSPTERDKLRTGRFEVDALHDLSATRADAKQASPSTDKQSLVLQVRAIAVGRLVIRNLAVARRIPIELTFEWAPPGQGAEPHALPRIIRARLRGAEAIPLAEHGIAPRNEGGGAWPEGEALLGRVIGRSALVEGEIALRPRVQ